MNGHSSILTCLNPVAVLTNTLHPYALHKRYGIDSEKSLYVFGTTESNSVNRDVVSTTNDAIDFIKTIESKDGLNGIYFADLNEIKLGELLERAIEENLVEIENGYLVFNDSITNINVEYLEQETNLTLTEHTHRSPTL